MGYDGIFFDSGGTIYGFAGDSSGDPSHADVWGSMATRALLPWGGWVSQQHLRKSQRTSSNCIRRVAQAHQATRRRRSSAPCLIESVPPHGATTWSM